MTTFKVLPKGLAARLVRGIEDELTPLAAKRQAQISTMPCPRCHSAMEPHFHPPHTFTKGDLLPRTLSKCVDCGCLVDPITGIVLDTGDPTKVEPGLPLIRPET